MRFKCQYSSYHFFFAERILELQLDLYVNLYRIKGHLETKATIQLPSPLEYPGSWTPTTLNFQFPPWLECGYMYFLEPDIVIFFHSLYFLFCHKIAVCRVPEINTSQQLCLMGKLDKFPFCIGNASTRRWGKNVSCFTCKHLFLLEAGEEAGRGTGICKEKRFDLYHIQSDLQTLLGLKKGDGSLKYAFIWDDGCLPSGGTLYLPTGNGVQLYQQAY